MPFETATPKLSKSRFLSGLQCHRRLWLECHHPKLAEERDAMSQAILAQGTAVGELARERFPGGVLVSEDHLHHREAVEQTRRLLADPAVPSIYEAAFVFDNIRIRADVLVRRADGRFDLYEVKASSGVKEEHVADVTIQVHVLRGAGIGIGRALLLHLDRSYVHPGGPYDLGKLFAAVDLSELAGVAGETITADLASMRAVLARSAEPQIETGPHCTRPYDCPFRGWCDRDAPEHPVGEIQHLGRAELERFRSEGIRDIREIPLGFEPLRDPRKQRIIDSVRSGRRYVSDELGAVLEKARFPLHFLDFETFMPALPACVGTRPYQTIVFQWSDHVLTRNPLSGRPVLDHREYLHGAVGDPRRPFALSLLEATADAGSIVVWSEYESRCLTGLAEALPDLAPALEGTRSCIFDLLPVVRENVYDPNFHGSFSIKRVLPALVPDLDYGDLEIREGGVASLAYTEIRDPTTSPARRAALQSALLAYCSRDTEAMVEIYCALRSLRD